MDKRSWANLMTTVLQLAREHTHKGGVIVLFADWRQLPMATDVMQWAGWIWRGVAPWDKGNSRPQKGRFRQQAEFVAWGSNGPLPMLEAKRQNYNAEKENYLLTFICLKGIISVWMRNLH